MKMKVYNLVCSVALVSTMLPLVGCKSDDTIKFTRNSEILYLINPLDWNKVPDNVNLKINDNYFSMDIDSFYRLLNQEENTIQLEGEKEKIVVDKIDLEQKSEMEFRNFQENKGEDYIKVMTMMTETAGALVLGKKIKQKIKTKS